LSLTVSFTTDTSLLEGAQTAEAQGFKGKPVDASGAVEGGIFSAQGIGSSSFRVHLASLRDLPAAIRFTDFLLKIIEPVSIHSSDPTELAGSSMSAPGVEARIAAVRVADDAWQIAMVIPASGVDLQVMAPTSAWLVFDAGTRLSALPPNAVVRGGQAATALVFPAKPSGLPDGPTTLSVDDWQARFTGVVDVPMPAACASP
jgi:hypothetical protein